MRKPWQRADGTPDRRKRGRAGQRERAAVLADEPLCRKCLELGLTTASTEVDHIIPLCRGGTDERANKQGLCSACHAAKTASESAASRRTPEAIELAAQAGVDLEGRPTLATHPWNAPRR